MRVAHDQDVAALLERARKRRPLELLACYLLTQHGVREHRRGECRQEQSSSAHRYFPQT
jgi:hypothetical protein